MNEWMNKTKEWIKLRKRNCERETKLTTKFYSENKIGKKKEKKKARINK